MRDIPVDIAILMGSESNCIFLEQVEVYPNAAKVKEIIDGYACDCHDPVSCSRRAFQLVILQASNGDPVIAAQFIEEAAEKCSNHAEIRQLMVDYAERAEAVEVIHVGSLEELTQLFGGILGGGTQH